MMAVGLYSCKCKWWVKLIADECRFARVVNSRQCQTQSQSQSQCQQCPLSLLLLSGLSVLATRNITCTATGYSSSTHLPLHSTFFFYSSSIGLSVVLLAKQNSGQHVASISSLMNTDMAGPGDPKTKRSSTREEFGMWTNSFSFSAILNSF